jgi:hypothetical protein
MKSLTWLLILAACLTTACDQDCPTTGSPNTTYNYSYKDSEGRFHFGSITTDAGGNATIADVPSDIDCSAITMSAEKPDPDHGMILSWLPRIDREASGRPLM